MLDKTVKNIYDRLYRKGLNISKDEIRARVVEINPDGNLTDSEKNSIVAYFIDNVKSLSQPTIDVTPDAGDVSKAALPETSGLANYKPITQQQATDIVFNQVEVLELDLKASEIKAIAKKMIDQNATGLNAVSTAISLLKELVNHQENQFNNSLQSSVNSLVSHVNDSLSRRNATAVSAFDTVRDELEASQMAYKSSCEDFEADLREYIASQTSV